MSVRFGRRAFALGAASVWLPGCEEDEASGPPPVTTPVTQRVAVVGAGIAGLHCAYCLKASDIEVQVYEAQNRPGGRVLTAREVFPDLYPSQTDADVLCELGAEFIGTNDACMRRLANELGIELEDASTGVPPDLKGRRYRVGGLDLDESAILTEFEQASPAFTSALQPGGEERARLDNTSLSAWLDANLPPKQFPLLGPVLSSAFRWEFGREPEELSALNLSALIGDPVSGKLELFQRRDARFRVSAISSAMSSAVPGMDQFAIRLTRALQDRVHFENRLTRITPKGDKFTLLFERPNGTGFETDADHVVLAVPFSVLREIDLSAVKLSPVKRTVIRELGYGTASKLAAAFARRTWRRNLYTGEVMDETRRLWDGALKALKPNTEYGLLTAMIGGKAGTASGTGAADATFQALLPELERLFPGITEDYVAGSAVRAHWPSSPYSLGSNSCYLPGQWALQGSEAQREGNLHFCGEHCSLDFQGRLEGAAETGAMAAGEIIEDLGETFSSYLAQLLRLKHQFDQPYDYEAKRDQPQANLTLLSRLGQVTEAHAEFVASSLGGP